MNDHKMIVDILNEFGINGENENGGTDKNTNHSYCEVYQDLLDPFVEKEGSLLEIGVRGGGSMILWNELLPRFKVFGLDIEDKLSEYCREYVNNNSNKVRLEFIDAYSKENIEYIKSFSPNGFEVIIDDGPHTEESQVNCIELYLDLLKDNGILIIEDIQDFSSIDVFKQSIPKSEFFDYEVSLYDRRGEKQRYDDVLFVIKKTSKKTENEKSKVGVFYHVGQFGNWQNLFHEQINSLVVSGLYQEADFIHIGINGEEELPFTFPKFVIKYNTNKATEADTLKSLHDFCKENLDYKVFYFHTKGATQEDTYKNFNVQKWRYYLEYFNVHKWKDCVAALENTDTAGVELIRKTGLINQDTGITEWEENHHYSGNYWWANAEYINRLDSNYLYLKDKGWERYRSEFWIGTANPTKTCFYNTDIFDKYEDWGNVTSLEYITKNNISKNSDKIAIFYHVYQTDDYEWIKLYHQQINALIVSGLYDVCDFIHIGINGDKELPFVLDKMKIQYNENKILEANTLQSLWEFCVENEDYKVLYFHTKGVTHKDNNTCEVTTVAWRLYLEYFVFHNWNTCVFDLNHYDCVGTEWVTTSCYNNYKENFTEHKYQHYTGNFWWANAEYVKTLDLAYLYSTEGDYDRLRSEFWIGTQKPKYKSYHNSNELLYLFYYSPDYYVKFKKKEVNEIVSMNSKVFIITPCTRPLNLSKISKSIPENCEWIVVFDDKVKNDYDLERGIGVKSPHTGLKGFENKNYGLEYIRNNLNPSDNDWVIVLHDDNIIHPNWWNSVSNHLNSDYSMITWGQCRSDEVPRIEPVDFPKVGNIDTSQYMVKWEVAKNIRFPEVYEADGIFAEECANKAKVLKLNEYLGYYNYLRSHKDDKAIPLNICMISMFKNESKGIRRMLESVWRYIDFYVFQDNGSTDGTPDIVREFFADKDIPGFIYNVEEGWVGFGWNRDHLLQKTLDSDHGCEWIMKMDCDEYLEVDNDFDWTPFYDKNSESFNVTAQSPGCIYYRTWIWNSSLPWKFYHDPAHECIYIDDERGENYQSTSLSRGFRMLGTNDGESYTVRTKYITDALKLEEKLIREDTMLTDLYHFWYIAKSYNDCYAGDFYPLGEEHSKEFVRRFIFYYKQYLKVINAQGIHEMSYYSAFSIGIGYSYLKEYQTAIEWLNEAEKYCPVRNEHIVHLALIYDELGQHEKMLEQTTRLIDPNRKLPFPDYCFLLNTSVYCDSSEYPQNLHNYAVSKIGKEKTIGSFSVNIETKPRLWIVDNFYDDPHAVRDFALNQEFEENLDYYKGNRSKQQYIVPGTKEAFEKILGFKITNWIDVHPMCGRFQYCTAQDDLVYHCDAQTWAGMIYLTPDAPYSCGTSLFAHKGTGLRNENDFGNINVFGETGFYDRTKFDLVDTAGNVFNRLVLFDAKSIHSANEYFGTLKENSRLFHLFFFD